MKNIFKSRYGLVLAISLITISVITALTLSSCNHANHAIVFDDKKGEKAEGIVATAQYVPNVDKFTPPQGISPKNASPSEQASGSKAISSKEDFANEINKYSHIENYAGAGKYLGYNIFEIKNEIDFITQNVHAFDQWVKLPLMREEQGYISIPYYENWSYLLELDEDSSRLSVTRLCHRTRCSYYDFDKNISVEEYDDGSSFVQYEIMKINYWFDENGKEAVECFIYSVGVDRFDIDNGLYHENAEDYKPFEYQYLKNVEDSYLVKYHITAAQRTRNGMDIRGLTPYGYRREFTVLNYEGYSDIELTEYDSDNFDFDVTTQNYKLLADTLGIGADEYASYTSSEQISKRIVDNFELKNNWQALYKGASESSDLDVIPGPFSTEDIILSNFYSHVYCTDPENLHMGIDADSNIYNINKLDLTEEYSLSLAVKEQTSGNIIVLFSHYRRLERILYAGGNPSSEQDYYYSVASLNRSYRENCFDVFEDGTYDVVCVLTRKDELTGEDIIVFDPLQPALLIQYTGLSISDKVDKDGVTHCYEVNADKGKLTITVTSRQ